MVPISYPGVPLDHDDDRQHRRLLAQAIEQLQNGRANNVLVVTLDANQSTTTVNDARISAFSVPMFSPCTANAAAEQAAGGLYVADTNRVHQSLVINHANNAQTDRTFKIVLFG